MTTTDLQRKITETDSSSSTDTGNSSPFEPRFIYFDLKVVEVTAHDSSDWYIPTEQKPFEMLQPGKTYSIEIIPATTPGQYSQQQGIPTGSKFQFRLICSIIQLDQEFALDASSRIFEFNVPPQSPTCDAVFILYYREGPGQKSKVATILQMKLRGTYNPDDQKLIDATQIDTSLAEQTAILHIAADANTLKMMGWCRQGELLQIDAVDWGVTKLAEFIRQGINPEDVIGTVRRLSRQKAGKLITWLRRLLENHGQQLCLIIADHTDLETPWEMLELDDDVYLGARAMVVRWFTINTFKGPHVLQFLDGQRQGSVLFYLDETALGVQQTSPERDILHSLKKTPCHDLADVKRYLRLLKTSPDVSLIYLASHGNEGEEVGSDLANRLTALQLELIKEPNEPRPIVFVNACESARLKRDGDYFIGLPEAFLARIASGYIGTLGRVDSTFASTVARRLLQAASAEPEGIRIAEVLRKLREEAVGEVVSSYQEEANEEVLIGMETRLLYAFMYVYYGNPQIKLKLDKAEISEATE
jgi:hypothetical protein